MSLSCGSADQLLCTDPQTTLRLYDTASRKELKASGVITLHSHYPRQMATLKQKKIRPDSNLPLIPFCLKLIRLYKKKTIAVVGGCTRTESQFDLLK